MAIIVDYSGSAISSILTMVDDLKRDPENAINLIRHIVLSTFQSYNRQHRNEYGQLILALDSKTYWRKDFFAFYKANRKKNRDKSSIPWELVFNALNSLEAELRANFPYRVIKVDKAEADDVIAVLVKYFQDHELIQDGLVEAPQPIMIISSDHDFKQLQKYPRVSQWSPKTKTLVKAERDYMTTGHIQHIVKASDDGIPSIVNVDNIFLQEGKRQYPVSAKRLNEFIEKGIQACRSDFEIKNWIRNQTLIDFEFIPESVQTAIINEYKASKPTGNKGKILNYLIENRCANLIHSIEDF